jgi:DNA polymerase sigma
MIQLVKQNADVYGYKNYSYRLLLTYFEERWPSYSVDLFGSLAAGVTLPNSDIDLLLTPL